MGTDLERDSRFRYSGQSAVAERETAEISEQVLHSWRNVVEKTLTLAESKWSRQRGTLAD